MLCFCGSLELFSLGLPVSERLLHVLCGTQWSSLKIQSSWNMMCSEPMLSGGCLLLCTDVLICVMGLWLLSRESWIQLRSRSVLDWPIQSVRFHWRGRVSSNQMKLFPTFQLLVLQVLGTRLPNRCDFWFPFFRILFNFQAPRLWSSWMENLYASITSAKVLVHVWTRAPKLRKIRFNVQKGSKLKLTMTLKGKS